MNHTIGKEKKKSGEMSFVTVIKFDREAGKTSGKANRWVKTQMDRTTYRLK